MQTTELCLVKGYTIPVLKLVKGGRCTLVIPYISVTRISTHKHHSRNGHFCIY
uniref:Uncharacterized protein n=1 Tax=Arundo donax TaxID=35708 RepID=A0A0A9A3G4_ARUDO